MTCAVRIPSFVLPTVFAAVAFAAVLWITRPPGPGLDPDAMSYLGAAESFVSHGTLRIPSGDWGSPDGTAPLDHFPPGFSLAIAVPLALGAPPVQAARGVEAVAAGVTMGLAVWLVTAVAGMLGGVLAGATLLVSPGLVLDHLRVLSEPLFLLLLVVALALLLRRPDRPFIHGIVAALASLVRYAGAAVGGAAALWALSRPGTWQRRLGHAAVAVAPTLLAQAAWALRTRAESGTVRTLGINGGVGATIGEGLVTLEGWLVPNVTHAGWGAVAASMASVCAVLLLWRGARRNPPFFSLLATAAFCYLGLVLGSRLFADAGIPLDERILSPLLLLAVLGGSAAAGLLWNEARPVLRAAGALALVVWLGASAWRTAQVVRDARDGGWGYADQGWQASGIVRWLRLDGAHRPVFSNNTPDVWFASGERSWSVPQTLDTVEVAAFGRVLRERGGVLVGFARELYPMADPADLARALGLVVLARFDQATVWGPPAR
jgi:hypothetical protein